MTVNKDVMLVTAFSDREFEILEYNCAKIVYKTDLDSSQLRDFEKECEICQDTFKNEDKIIYLPKCNHVFHWNCAKEWLKVKAQCPTCRSGVRTNLLRELYDNPANDIPPQEIGNHANDFQPQEIDAPA